MLNHALVLTQLQRRVTAAARLAIGIVRYRLYTCISNVLVGLLHAAKLVRATRNNIEAKLTCTCRVTHSHADR